MRGHGTVAGPCFTARLAHIRGDSSSAASCTPPSWSKLSHFLRWLKRETGRGRSGPIFSSCKRDLGATKTFQCLGLFSYACCWCCGSCAFRWTMTLLGLALLGLTPQAQDLSWNSRGRDCLVDAVVFCSSSSSSGRCPRTTRRDFCSIPMSRLQAQLGPYTNQNGRCCRRSLHIWVPRVLGLLTFVAVLIAIGRSAINVPTQTTRPPRQQSTGVDRSGSAGYRRCLIFLAI